jgi:hypothetical protein
MAKKNSSPQKDKIPVAQAKEINYRLYGVVITAILGLIGVVVSSYFGYLQKEIEIRSQATLQSANATQVVIATTSTRHTESTAQAVSILIQPILQGIEATASAIQTQTPSANLSSIAVTEYGAIYITESIGIYDSAAGIQIGTMDKGIATAIILDKTESTDKVGEWIRIAFLYRTGDPIQIGWIQSSKVTIDYRQSGNFVIQIPQP